LFTLSKTKVHTAVAIGLAAMGIGASSASAAPAQFNAPGSQFVLPVGPISISWGTGPGQSRTCPANTATSAITSNSAGQGKITNFPWNPRCTTSNGATYPMKWDIWAPMLAQKNNGVFSLTSNGPINVNDLNLADGPATRITSELTPTPYTAAWQNPAPQYSTFTFSNTAVANVYDSVTHTTTPLRVTGTFRIGWGSNFYMF
jgi:hypothetical protein